MHICFNLIHRNKITSLYFLWEGLGCCTEGLGCCTEGLGCCTEGLGGCTEGLGCCTEGWLVFIHKLNVWNCTPKQVITFFFQLHVWQHCFLFISDDAWGGDEEGMRKGWGGDEEGMLRGRVDDINNWRSSFFNSRFTWTFKIIMQQECSNTLEQYRSVTINYSKYLNAPHS